MPFRVVVSNKDRSFQKDVDAPTLVGLSIGEKVDGALVGLAGYELEITGGSDKEGFPMRKDLSGVARRKLLLSKGTGFNNTRHGERNRKSVTGRMIGERTLQINTKVVKAGDKPVHELWGLTPKPTKTETRAAERAARKAAKKAPAEPAA